MPPKGAAKKDKTKEEGADLGACGDVKVELVVGEKDAQNLDFHTELQGAWSEVTAKFTGIEGEDPLSIAEGGSQRPFSQKDLKAALKAACPQGRVQTSGRVAEEETGKGSSAQSLRGPTEGSLALPMGPEGKCFTCNERVQGTAVALDEKNVVLHVSCFMGFAQWHESWYRAGVLLAAWARYGRLRRHLLGLRVLGLVRAWQREQWPAMRETLLYRRAWESWVLVADPTPPALVSSSESADDEGSSSAESPDDEGGPLPTAYSLSHEGPEALPTELLHAFEAAANMDLTPGSGHLGPFVAVTEFDASSHDDDDSWAGSDALE